ncbi:MAG: PilN domain-containing protein [Candidatus Omnitrophica bacterium]|nr:PilN domain-containing protein [Candidatus Omnitrophota bacterium]
MLKVNLLPPEQRKKVLSPIEQFHRTPFMWMVAAGMLALPLVLLVPIGVSREQLRKLNEKIQSLEPRQMEVERLQRVLQTSRAQEAAFQRLAKGHGLWSERFNTLSDVTPDGVWFTELTLDPAKGLIIQGSAIGQGDPGAVSVTRLVQGLQADPHFMSAVKDIQIESIKRTQEGEIEVMQFTLNCALQEAPTS